MAMGGLWECWTSPEGETLRTFCIITTAANEVMAPIHDRMPVLLARDDWGRWLDPESKQEDISPLVCPAPAATIEVRPVSRKVSNAREDGPELIEPEDP